MLGSFPPLRGISSYCFELARALSDEVEIEFLSFKSMYPSFLYPGGGLSPDHTFQGFSHPNLIVRSALTWYNPTGWVKEGLGLKSHILHAQWWSLPLFPEYFCIICLSRLKGIKVIVTCHNVSSHEESRSFSLATRLILSLAQGVIVHSGANYKELVKFYGIPDNRISVVPHGPLGLFKIKGPSRETARKRLDLPQDAHVALFFGALRAYKGIEPLIRAFKILVTRHKRVFLLIAGKPWEDWTYFAHIIKSLALESRTKCVLGYIEAKDVEDFFSACDIVVLPYLKFDGQSGVGSVAAAFKRPMVVTDCGGLPELVYDKRFVVEPGDPDALARAMELALFDKSLRAGEVQFLRQYVEDTSWGVIARKTRHIYENHVRSYA
jgi:glycosyltransferase involved in cell wall biosynthesis